ncbi:hypothetical protein V497_04166 [Pseudogymnoascus sp. VKM F-4516 (FW-969)]|nr:hypothetical protein V497_04166 [Pseudogymnoascus sp. VKM F-4516 (FW-969)]
MSRYFPASLSSRSSSPVSSTSSNSTLPITPRCTSPTPSYRAAEASLHEREAALENALKKLEDEKVDLELQRAMVDDERKTNNLVRATNEREKADLAAKKRCNVSYHSCNGEPEGWKIALGLVGGLFCLFPAVFTVGVALKIQARACENVALWVLGKFGM